MRTKIFNFLAVGVLLLAASCSLHDDTETFDKPAAERLQETVAEDKALLESASNGWELHLWTGEEYSGGGYTYLMRFNNGKVTVAGDVADSPEERETSSYDIIDDQGPVLTVNTYNSIFHKLADPERDGDDGEQQDYEFVIMRTTNDSIYLRGKKWNNRMVMTRLADDVDWTDELNKIKSVSDGIMPTFVINNGSDSIGTLSLENLESSRQATINVGGSTENVAYYVSPTGIVFQKPVNLNGVELHSLILNSETMNFTSSDAGGQNVLFKVNLPDNYMYYNDFVGTWRLRSGSGSVFNITLTPAGDGSSFIVTGFGDGITVRFNYVKATGSLEWLAQRVGTAASGNDAYLLAWALDPQVGSGSIYYSLQLGLNITRDMSRSGTVLTFSDNSSNGITSFYIVETTGVPSNSTWVGTQAGLYFSDGYSSIAYLATYGSMTKVSNLE